MAAPKRLDRNLAAGVAIALAAIFFVALNVFVGARFTSARVDLTQDRLFTLADGTRQVLAAIDEPITLRFYRSAALDRLGPYYTAFADRVSDMLDEYVRRSHGKIRLERYDPQPYSPEEDLALGDGLQGITVSNDGTQVYFGIAGSNSTDDVSAIPYLAPERARFLEYDLTRLVFDLANPEKKAIAVLGDYPLPGNQLNGFRRAGVLDAITQFFDVKYLYGSIDRIPDKVSVALIAQPEKLDEKTLYAIDQFVMRGGRLLVFVDPYAESMAATRPRGAKAPDAIATMEPLFAAWGVAIDKGKFVGDADAASRVQVVQNGRNVVTDYIAWIAMGAKNFAKDDVVMDGLKQINFKSAGAIRARDGATTKITPLITSNDQAMEVAVDQIRQMPDPVALLKAFAPAGKRFVLAARVSGPVKSAFPDGPPASVTDKTIRAAQLSKAKAPLAMILVADSDVLDDGSWMRTQSLLGQRFNVPIANNADFTINALDNLSGSRGLIGLRARGLGRRPFEVIDAMQRSASERYRATEQKLLSQIDGTKKKIDDLQRTEKEAGVLLTAEQQRAIDDFRVKMIDLRRQLRDVQHALRENVDRLETRIRVLDIWAVPAVLALVAIGLALYRRRRVTRAYAHGHG